ncbi:MAG: VOC family protein [Bacteroidia bacterium]|nr:VOC family protein [Bacteroidia bacterium]
MKQNIINLSFVVREYEEALDFFTRVLNFDVLEDFAQPEQNKRWIRVAPKGSTGPALVLGRAKNEAEKAAIGNQTGGRVFLFLHTDDFWRDYNDLRSKGVEFVRDAKEEAYGTVAVFKDLYGNLWDLIEHK